jgi:tRNA(Ile2) C34 agmatinyltransferase TiaS
MSISIFFKNILKIKKMKNTIIPSLILAFLLTSCGTSKNNETKTVETVAVSDSTKTHTCSMHPEIAGKKGDKCAKCGMELVAVKTTGDSTKMK